MSNPRRLVVAVLERRRGADGIPGELAWSVHPNGRECIESRLDRHHFVVVNRALMANLRRITELDLKGKIKQVGIVINAETEWLSVSRRPLEPLLRRLGFSKRRAVSTENLQASPVRQGQ